MEEHFGSNIKILEGHKGRSSVGKVEAMREAEK
jgi:hypothetical protein